MSENLSYRKYFKTAFFLNLIGIVLTFLFKGNIGAFGTLLIIAALILAIIGFLKKKKQEK